ncbi:hypothetical protein WG66_010531 [Moniliophthora roreri]|nr:hypothetical protein WG66_010531 [Moniliophthora roreri]
MKIVGIREYDRKRECTYTVFRWAEVGGREPSAGCSMGMIFGYCRVVTTLPRLSAWPSGDYTWPAASHFSLVFGPIKTQIESLVDEKCQALDEGIGWVGTVQSGDILVIFWYFL